MILSLNDSTTVYRVGKYIVRLCFINSITARFKSVVFQCNSSFNEKLKFKKKENWAFPSYLKSRALLQFFDLLKVQLCSERFCRSIGTTVQVYNEPTLCPPCTLYLVLYKGYDME